MICENKQGRQFKEGHRECPILGPKFLLFDGWWKLSDDVIQGPFYCNQCSFIQKIHEEQRLIYLRNFKGMGGTPPDNI